MKQIAQLISAMMLVSIALAGEPTVSPTPEPRFKISGWVEGGITFNPDNPNSRQNFGRLFDDRANELLLNQAVVTLERTLASAPAGFEWGFKLQFMLGSDARFIHSLGLFDRTSNGTVQFDLVEGYLNLHFPVATEGGLDLKVGKFVTLEGAETIDPRANFFYSHTYIFNFGIPFNHTGGLVTFHANKLVDLYAGITQGVNTSIEDNNDPVDGLRGGSVTFDPLTVGGGKTTYGAVTLGLNIKPPVPKPAASLVIRPELRFDGALNGTRPFNDSSDSSQFTAGIDVIITF